MKRTSKITAFLALLAVVALMADTSDAGWRRHGSSGSSGSSGSYGSSGSSGSWGSSGSSGYGWGHYHYSYSSGSSGSSSSGSSGSSSWGSSGSSGYHSSGSYGSHGSSGSYGYGYVVYPSYNVTYSTPAIRSTQVVQSSTAAPMVTRVQTPPDNRARIQMTVPQDADVYLVGQKMTLTGSQRTYRLPELPAGQSYAYPIKVEVVRDGQAMSVEHSEQVTAGVTTSIAIVEQAGRLVVQTDGSGRLVADSR